MGHRELVLIDGVEAPSVTKVLNIVAKPFLYPWYAKLGWQKAQAILHDSQDIGHNFHEAIECYFRGESMPDMDERAAQMFALWRGWALESRFNPVELELNVQSAQYKYHGTFDAIGHFGDDKLIIVDWKTSSGVDALYGAQLSAYAQAYKEVTGIEITEGLVVRVDKKESSKKPFEVVRFESLPKYFDVFLNCLELYNFTNKKGKWSKDNGTH